MKKKLGREQKEDVLQRNVRERRLRGEACENHVGLTMYGGRSYGNC